MEKSFPFPHPKYPLRTSGRSPGSSENFGIRILPARPDRSRHANSFRLEFFPPFFSPAFLTEPNFPKFLIFFFFGMFSQDYPRSWCSPQGWINPCATNFPLFSTTNIPAAFASSFPRSSPSWRIRYSRNSRFSYLTFCWIIPKKNLEYSQSQLRSLPRCLKAVCIHSNLSRSQQEAAMEKVTKNSPNSRFFFFFEDPTKNKSWILPVFPTGQEWPSPNPAAFSGGCGGIGIFFPIFPGSFPSRGFRLPG